LQARIVLDALKRCGVSHVVGLPDNTSAGLFALLSGDPDVLLVSVTREGEAFAVAAGLWIGGATPAVLVQNTGFLESGDSFRGTVMRMRIPVLCLVTYRGYRGMKAAASGAVPGNLTAEILSRPDLDSTALMTEPTLAAWGVRHRFLHDIDPAGDIAGCFDAAVAGSEPFVLLVTESMD
jgi:sulfopyruvate decarboxylase TPP-binding subunit